MEAMIIILLALIGVLSLVSTVVLGLIAYKVLFLSSKKYTGEAQAPNTYYPTPERDEIELERQRRKIQAEADAFQELMNFSADKAYGIEPKE